MADEGVEITRKKNMHATLLLHLIYLPIKYYQHLKTYGSNGLHNVSVSGEISKNGESRVVYLSVC